MRPQIRVSQFNGDSENAFTSLERDGEYSDSIGDRISRYRAFV